MTSFEKLIQEFKEISVFTCALRILIRGYVDKDSIVLQGSKLENLAEVFF